MASSLCGLDGVSGVLAQDLQQKVLESKILVVGAGGIGCEVLKNLVMTGFKNIEIIDLDTIDVSNLNRQFLFHKEHVGKSKATVAKESALSFNPDSNITAYHDSITTTNYGVSFFQKFTLVLNALDNRAARNHVNRMCLTADIPLIESGTAGYNGQVELIKKGLTQCYECQPKAAQKSYPGCTIRNTPSEPIHCIVWAKHLFNQLFGEYSADDDVSPDTADPEATSEAGADALSAETKENGNVTRVSTRQWAQGCNYNPKKLFNKLFHDDIKYLLSMANLWKNRQAPLPADFDALEEPSTSETENGQQNGNTSQLRDQKVWSLAECGKVFEECVTNLRDEVEKLKEGDNLVWDKDDKNGMDFVAACANIRAHIFGIAKKSRFEIKSMAGNIIPAIATTNAITAGFVVMHALKILQNKYEKCQSVYMRLRPNARNQLMVPDKNLTPPNLKCYVCAAKPEVVLKVNTKVVTVKELRDEILIKALNMVDPEVMLDGKGLIVISSEEGETEENNDKKLCDMFIVDGCILKVDDFFQNYELTVTVLHKDTEHDEVLFEVIADPDSLKAKVEEEAADDKKKPVEGGDGDVEMTETNGTAGVPTDKATVVEDDDDDLCIIEDEEEPKETKQEENGGGSSSSQKPSSVPEKRKNQDEEGPSSKKAKVLAPVDDDLICIDDD